MSKKEMLDLMRLLSALESWAMSRSERLPDYLHLQSSPHSTRCLGTRMDTGLMCLHTAQGKRCFRRFGQKIPMRIRVSFQRRAGSFILPLAGCKL